MMKKRNIGASDLLVAPLAFGGNVFGWTIDERTSFSILDAFVEKGFNLVDTADVYSRWAGHAGISETIIGKWMKQRNNREKIVLATKVGMDLGEGKKGLSKKYILSAVEDSLKRLQTDHIDLYQSHKDDESVPVEETLAAYGTLIKQGKVRYIGASNFSSARLRESAECSAKNGLPEYICLQPHYNLCERALFEKDLEQTCTDLGLGVLTYYSLASGFLTGKYRSANDAVASVRGNKAVGYLDEKGKRILAVLDQLAAAHKVRPAAIALAWLIARPSVTAPIASATSIEQLSDIAAAVHVKLSSDDIAALDRASEWREEP
jgi:aryl-alcohol dehydrogenase-like predicted oxidoreductase